MTAFELISGLRDSGFKVQIDKGKIRCVGPAGILTSEVRAALERLKPEVLAILGKGNSGSAIRSEAGIDQLEPDLVEAGRETALLNQAAVRIMRLDGIFTIGVWSDLNNGEIRQALRTLKLASLPVRYLDGAGIPARYKLRRVDGKPVPMDVLRVMEQNPEQPWLIRDRMQKDCDHVGEASLGRRQTPNQP
jgi:hypothetical protein